MTPEEIAKQCAEAIVQGKSTYKRDYRALIVEKLTPTLTAHLAAREEEHARLREAAKLIYGSLKDARDNGEFTTRGFLGIAFEDLPKLREALTPQQEPGK